MRAKATLITALAAIAAVPTTPAAADVFGTPRTFGSTTADVGHLSLLDGDRRSTAAASAGRNVFLAPVTARGFGSVRRARLRTNDHELGPFVVTDRRGRVLTVESVRRRPVAVWFAPSGRRLRTQRLTRRDASWEMSSSERGDAVIAVSPDGGARRYLRARPGRRFRRIPSPPRGPGQSPNLYLDPAGRVRAVYTHANRVLESRRGLRGGWTRLRTVFAGGSTEGAGFTPVDFAPNGDALIVFDMFGTPPVPGSLYGAWARRGKPFGRPRRIAAVASGGPFPDTDLARGGRAIVSWTDDPDSDEPGDTIGVATARFGGGFTTAWRSPRRGGTAYVEAAAGLVTWLEEPGSGAASSVRAATVRGRNVTEEVVATAPPGTAIYSNRLSIVGGRPMLAWIQVRPSTSQRTFRGALARR